MVLKVWYGSFGETFVPVGVGDRWCWCFGVVVVLRFGWVFLNVVGIVGVEVGCF